MDMLVLALWRCRCSSLAMLPLDPHCSAARMKVTRKDRHCRHAQVDHDLLVHMQLTPGRIRAQPVSSSNTGSAFPTFTSGHKFSMLLAAGSLAQKLMAFAQKIFYSL